MAFIVRAQRLELCAPSYIPASAFRLPSHSLMNPMSAAPAAFAQPTPGELALSGRWTALGTGDLELRKLDAIRPQAGIVAIDGAGVEALDTVGARVLQNLLDRLRTDGHEVQLRGW